MSICLIGLNHKTAPIEIRESVAFTEASLPAALRSLQTELNIPGAVILSTCNRVEILCSHAKPAQVIRWLLQFHQVNNRVANHCYAYEGNAAIKHAMQVASGIDSLVLGEPQILGQFKQAYQTSDEAGLLDPKLRHACEHIFAAAKAVRYETAISHCPVSVAFSAIKLAQQTMADMPEHSVLLIGAGETANLLCKHLQSMQVNSLTIANRTLASAQQLAKQYDAQAATLTQLPELLSKADIVISATNSDAPLITHAMLAKLDRKQTLLMIDLAVPRDIDPTVAELDYVTLQCVDDIQQLIQNNTLQRSQAATQANAMIETFVMAYQRKRKARAADGTICSIRQHAESLRDAELDKALKQLAAGADPETVLRQFAHSLTNKFTHKPSINLQSAGAEDNDLLLTAAEKLFQ